MGDSTESSPAAATAVSRRAVARRAAVLGCITLSSSLAMNMYVPAFPEIAAALHTDINALQLSITSYLIALAVGQNIYGPLSDRFGRKPPLHAGLLLFTLASIGVALADTLPTLVAWRFVQGFGACAAIVIPRAIVRDMHTGADAARMIANVVLVVSMSPLLAPFAGSAVSAAFGWNAIFWTIGAIGFCVLLLGIFALPETLPPKARTVGWSALGHYGALLRNRTFLCTAMMVAAGQAVYFAYLAASAVVFMDHFGLDSWGYSIVFATGAAAWAGSSQLAPVLMRRFEVGRISTACVQLSFAITAILFGAALAGLEGLWLLIGAVMLLFPTLAVLLPTGTVAALHPHGAVAGSAAALIGTLGYAVGAAATGLVSALADGTELPMLGVMAGCALLSTIMAWLAFRGPPMEL